MSTTRQTQKYHVAFLAGNMYYLLKFSFELLVFPLIPFDLIAGFVERVNVELRELGPDLEVYYCRKDSFFNKYMNICTYIMNILGKY